MGAVGWARRGARGRARGKAGLGRRSDAAAAAPPRQVREAAGLAGVRQRTDGGGPDEAHAGEHRLPAVHQLRLAHVAEVAAELRDRGAEAQRVKALVAHHRAIERGRLLQEGERRRALDHRERRGRRMRRRERGREAAERSSAELEHECKE
eukprot:gene9506-biopygen2505